MSTESTEAFIPYYGNREKLVTETADGVHKLLRDSLGGYFESPADIPAAMAALAAEIRKYVQKLIEERNFTKGGILMKEVQRPPGMGAVFAELNFNAKVDRGAPLEFLCLKKDGRETNLWAGNAGLIPQKAFEGAERMVVGFTYPHDGARELFVPCTPDFPGVYLNRADLPPDHFQGCLPREGVLLENGRRLYIPMRVIAPEELRRHPQVIFTRKATEDDFPGTEERGGLMYLSHKSGNIPLLKLNPAKIARGYDGAGIGGWEQEEGE